MELTKTKLQCGNCRCDFVHEAINRVEHCFVEGSPHYGKVISWDDKHQPHDIDCPKCGLTTYVRIL